MASHLHVVEYLATENHCDVSVRDAWDDTAANDAVEVLKYLLQEGPHTLGQKKSHLLRRALESGPQNIISYLVST